MTWYISFPSTVNISALEDIDRPMLGTAAESISLQDAMLFMLCRHEGQEELVTCTMDLLMAE